MNGTSQCVALFRLTGPLDGPTNCACTPPGLQQTASRGNFKELKVDNTHKEQVKAMLRGEIKPVRLRSPHSRLPTARLQN